VWSLSHIPFSLLNLSQVCHQCCPSEVTKYKSSPFVPFLVKKVPVKKSVCYLLQSPLRSPSPSPQSSYIESSLTSPSHRRSISPQPSYHIRKSKLAILGSQPTYLIRTLLGNNSICYNKYPLYPSTPTHHLILTQELPHTPTFDLR
jgi:hypothetical protein